MEKIDAKEPLAVMEAARVLKAGGIVMHPTETCYGLAVDIFNEVALEKLYKLKGRDADKPLSILIYGAAMANEYGVFSDKAQSLAEKYWPGPLSIVVPRRETLPAYLNKSSDFVSLRFSNEDFTNELTQAFHTPLTTTSANLSGEPPLYEANVEAFGELADLIDLVVDGGVLPEVKPSTIVKVVGDEIEVLRQGEIKI